MSTKPRWHLGHLDSLRGIAVLGVVMVHSVLINNAPLALGSQHLEWIAMTGQRGVSLFFVVSAFTLFLSLDNRREEHRPIRNFFIRRFFRLAPMFYLAFILTLIMQPQMAGPHAHIPLVLLFLHGLSPQTITSGAIGGWSVADEAIFYACLPFLFAKIKTLKSALIWCTAGTIIGHWLAIELSAQLPKHAEFFLFQSFSSQFPIFLLGICAYFLWKEFIADATISRSARKQLSFIALILTGVLYWSLLPFTYATLYQSSLVCVLLLVALMLHPWSLLVNPLTRLIGKISYSIYLLHFVVFLAIQRWIASSLSVHPVLEHHGLQWALCFLGTLVITAPVAVVTWRWIEEPGIRLGRRLIDHLEGRAVSRKEEALVPPMQAVTQAGNSPDAQF